MDRVQPLDYGTPRIAHAPSGLWIVVLWLGIMQFPWMFGFLMEFYNDRSLKPVRLVQDSLFFLLATALTFLALGAGIFCIYQSRNARRVLTLILCGIVVAVSVLVLGWAANEWYSQV